MAFADAVARDMEFIHTRTAAEFGVAVLFWNKGLDPSSDDATTTTRGTRFAQAKDRQETNEGESEMRTVLVTVTRAGAASIDEEGQMSVDGVVYAIEYVHGDDPATWTIKGSRDEIYSHGDSSRLFGD